MSCSVRVEMRGDEKAAMIAALYMLFVLHFRFCRNSDTFPLLPFFTQVVQIYKNYDVLIAGVSGGFAVLHPLGSISLEKF